MDFEHPSDGQNWASMCFLTLIPTRTRGIPSTRPRLAIGGRKLSRTKLSDWLSHSAPGISKMFGSIHRPTLAGTDINEVYSNGAGLVAIDLPLDKLDCRLFHPILLLLMTNPLHEHHDADRMNYAPWRELIPFIVKAVSSQQSKEQDPTIPSHLQPSLGFFGDLFSYQTKERFSSTTATIQQDPNTALPPSADYRLFSYTSLQFLYWSITNIPYVNWLPKEDVELEQEGLVSLDGVPVAARIFARGMTQTLVWEYVARNLFPNHESAASNNINWYVCKHHSPCMHLCHMFALH